MTKAPVRTAWKKVATVEPNAPQPAAEAAPEPSAEIMPPVDTPAAPATPDVPSPPPQMVMPAGLQQILMNAAKPPPERIYVSFSAEINPNTTEALIALCANHANQGVKEIYLMMSTPGGTVMNGLNLYNVLRALPVKLITHNVGNVDSIGNAVFLAGEERYACFHSTFMFHGVGYDMPGAAPYASG